MTEITFRGGPGRPALKGDYRPLGGEIPKQLWDLVYLPVSRTDRTFPYRIKRIRVTDLVRAGLANRPAEVRPHIRTLYGGTGKLLVARIPDELAQQVLAPFVEPSQSGVYPSITERWIELLHYGLQTDPHTEKQRAALAFAEAPPLPDMPEHQLIRAG